MSTEQCLECLGRYGDHAHSCPQRPAYEYVFVLEYYGKPTRVALTSAELEPIMVAGTRLGVQLEDIVRYRRDA